MPEPGTKHDHGPGRALSVGTGLTFAFAGIEVAAGLMFGSLALISDAGHMLVDSSGLLLALLAAGIARRPADLRRTYGYTRVEVIVVPVQVALMLATASYVAYEAVRRIGSVPSFDGASTLVVGAIGLGINVIVLRLLHPHAAGNLSARGASLEVAFDMFGSTAVIVAAIAQITLGWSAVDVGVSLLIAALIVPRALVLLLDVLRILFEGVPKGVDLMAIEADARAVPGVAGVHDLHVWALTPAFVALSAHLEVEAMSGAQNPLAGVTRVLRERHGIVHVTLQPETPELHRELECCTYPEVRHAWHEH
jgi:cobalt-zinc-cadmium efflux system protein